MKDKKLLQDEHIGQPGVRFSILRQIVLLRRLGKENVKLVMGGDLISEGVFNE